jgi:hypothetical protein
MLTKNRKTSPHSPGSQSREKEEKTFTLKIVAVTEYRHRAPLTCPILPTAKSNWSEGIYYIIIQKRQIINSSIIKKSKKGTPENRLLVTHRCHLAPIHCRRFANFTQFPYLPSLFSFEKQINIKGRILARLLPHRTTTIAEDFPLRYPLKETVKLKHTHRVWFASRRRALFSFN